jgi:hypothetical protein
MKRIINCETGEVIERELNAEEIAQQEIDEANIQAAQAINQAEAVAKTTARQALLTKLGITQEEAQLLLGGN